MPTTEREKPRHDTVMDVTEEQIARVYAKAFLGVVGERANVGDLVDEVTAIVSEVLDKFPKLEETLRSALVAQEDKEKILDGVFGKRVATDVLHFLKVLSRHDRLVLLRSASRQIRTMYQEQCGQEVVEVRVARDLDESLWEEIRNELRTRRGKEPILKVVVDPSLIAGLVARTGDRVFDCSVRSQLNDIRKSMIARSIEIIETQPEKFFSAAK
jgi:F-type H+-transporting ATPase subunit delta